MWKVLALFLAANAAFGAVRGAYHNHFAIELDYVLLTRTNSHNKHLVSAAGGPEGLPAYLEPPSCAKEKGKELIESKELINDMNFDTGFSAALKAFQSIWVTWELRYTGGFAWKGKKTRHCLRNLNLDGALAFETEDYNFADRVKAVLNSDMSTIELNFWRHVSPRYTDHFSVSWLAGLRYFDIDEKINLFFTKVRPTFNHNSRYRLKTENNSFGLQLGGDIEYNPYHFLTWGLAVKVGGLFNRGKQKTLMRDENNTVIIRDHDRSGSNFAYMAQIYPFIELRPTKHFFFIVNYQFLYVGNMVTADRNLRFHGSGSLLDHEGHVIYHGFTGGIQFNF